MCNIEGTEGGQQTSYGMWLGGAGSPPAGYGAEPRRKLVFSKMKKKYNTPVAHQVSPLANVLGQRPIFRQFMHSDQLFGSCLGVGICRIA